MATYVKKINEEYQQLYGEEYELMTDEQLASNAIFKLEGFFPTPNGKQFVGFEFPEVDGKPTLSPVFVDRDLNELKDELKPLVANIRWEKETGGFLFNGIPLATDDRSQLKFIGILLAVQMDPTYTVNFKTASGEFVTLNAPQILAAVTAVRSHVQACFDHEETLLAAIDAAQTHEELEQIDILAGWPT